MNIRKDEEVFRQGWPEDFLFIKTTTSDTLKGEGVFL